MEGVNTVGYSMGSRKFQEAEEAFEEVQYEESKSGWEKMAGQYDEFYRGKEAPVSEVTEALHCVSEVTQALEVENQRVDDLIAWTGPLLEMWALMDTIMREDDWSTIPNLKIGMGRIRRQWEAIVKEFDPDAKG
jgi:hypothetical protein